MECTRASTVPEASKAGLHSAAGGTGFINTVTAPSASRLAGAGWRDNTTVSETPTRCHGLLRQSPSITTSRQVWEGLAHNTEGRGTRKARDSNIHPHVTFIKLTLFIMCLSSDFTFPLTFLGNQHI